MANKTVYPFGSGGELPSSIGIVNDLETGGADKALSAEQGKVLNEKIEGETIFENSYTKSANNRLSQALNIGHGGESVKITVACTSENDSGNYKIYATTLVNDVRSMDTTNLLVDTTPLGTTQKMTIPSDGYIWAYCGNHDATSRTYKVTVIEYGIKDDVTVLQGEVDNCESDITALQAPFTGTDGTNNGTKGLVPAPQTTDKGYVLGADGSWENNGYYIYKQESVNNNSQRTKNYTSVKAGDKIAVRVSSVSGTSNNYSLYWIKSGGNVAVYTGQNMGYLSDVLTVPNDATGISIFMGPSASGNVNLVEVFDPSKSNYLLARLGYNFDGMEYLNNRNIIAVEKEVEADNSSAVTFLSQADCNKLNLKGKLYVVVEGTATLKNSDGVYGYIRFSYGDSTYDDITQFTLNQNRQSKLITWEGNDYKKLNEVIIPTNQIATSGTFKITLMTIEPTAYYQRYPLFGKKWMCFGDSITEFKSNAGMDNRRYSDHLAILTGANMYNAGIGGTRLSPRDDLSATPADNQQAVAAFEIYSLVEAWATNTYTYQDAALSSGKLTEEQQTLYTNKLNVLKNNSIANFDIVTIFGGTNDYTGGSAIGTNDLTNLNERTICGAINKMIKLLLTAKPTLRIYFFTPIIRMFQSTVSVATSSDVVVHSDAPDGKLLPELCDIIETAVKNNHTPVDNWYWSLGWNVYNFTTYFGTDYTHPYHGFQYLAEKISKFVLNS